MEDIGMVMFTDEQLKVVKSVVEYAEQFADGLWKIMQNHGIDKIAGSGILIEVNPDQDLCNRRVEFGKENSPAGFVTLTRGKTENKYTCLGKNSPEYEFMFAPPEWSDRMREIVKGSKPLPPDGLWVGREPEMPRPIVTPDGQMHGKHIAVGYQFKGGENG